MLHTPTTYTFILLVPLFSRHQIIHLILESHCQSLLMPPSSRVLTALTVQYLGMVSSKGIFTVEVFNHDHATRAKSPMGEWYSMDFDDF